MTGQQDFNELANKILSNYFRDKYEIAKAKLGNANANFIVTHLNEKYFFRIYLPVKDFPRSYADIEKELNVIKWFYEKGITVARAFPDLNGNLLVQYNDYFCALFEFIPGEHVYGKLKVEHLFEIGKLMGQVHSETEKAELKCDKKWSEGNFWTRLFNKVEENRSLLNSKDLELYDKLKSAQSKLELVAQYLIHGDYNLANILFDENNNIVGLLDFDDYRMGHFMDDAIRSFVCELIYTPAEDYFITSASLNAFWNGYQENRKLSEADFDLIFLYIDLHYLSGLISLKKKDSIRVEEFISIMDEFRSLSENRFKRLFQNQ